jgi:hypothetical protein
LGRGIVGSDLAATNDNLATYELKYPNRLGVFGCRAAVSRLDGLFPEHRRSTGSVAVSTPFSIKEVERADRAETAKKRFVTDKTGGSPSSQASTPMMTAQMPNYARALTVKSCYCATPILPRPWERDPRWMKLCKKC